MMTDVLQQIRALAAQSDLARAAQLSGFLAEAMDTAGLRSRPATQMEAALVAMTRSKVTRVGAAAAFRKYAASLSQVEEILA